MFQHWQQQHFTSHEHQSKRKKKIGFLSVQIIFPKCPDEVFCVLLLM